MTEALTTLPPEARAQVALSSSQVLDWLLAMDLDAVTEAIAAEFI